MSKAEQQRKDDRQATTRSFQQWLETLDGGQAISELAAEAQQVLLTCKREAVSQNSKVKGKIMFTLAFEVEPSDNDISKTTYAISKKEPAKKFGGSIYFIDKNGNLTREAPKQMRLPIRVIDTEGEARDVCGEEPEAREV